MDVCDVPVISGVCDAAGEAAGALVSAPFDWLAQVMGNAAAWMFESVWAVFDSTTMVDITSSQYTKVYNILFGVAVFVMLGFFMLQVIGGTVRREPAALTRAALGLAKSILGSFVALALLATALEITDQPCIGLVNAAGTNMSEMGDRIGLLTARLAGINVAAPGAGAVLTIFLAGLAIGAAVIVWISLLVRKALLLVAIVFAPIALAGSSWDQTRGWVGKWAQFVVALILSKVVLVVIFLLATAQVSAPIDADLQSVSEPIAGVVLMLIAGFDARYPDPARMLDALRRLEAAAMEWRSSNAEIGERLGPWIQNTTGLRYAGSDQELERRSLGSFSFEGSKWSRIPHIKIDDAKHSNQVGRIYFAIDSGGRRWIVDHVGQKLYGR